MDLTIYFSVLACLVAYIVVSFVRDPLREIPGPFLAKCTGIWLILLDNSGFRSQTLHKLHQKYGPVIRIGPAQLSFSTRQAMRDIYGLGSAYIKAPAYGAFGRKSLFTMRVKEEHRARHKRIAHIFGPTSVAGVEPIIAEHTSKLLNVLNQKLGEPMDVLLWFRMLALDVTSDIFFGKNFGCLEEQKAPQILHDLDEVFPVYWIEWQFPLLFRLLLLIPHKQLHSFLTAGHRFYGYGAEAFHDYVNRYGRKGDRRDLLQKMIAVSEEPGAPAPLPDQDIIVEITNLIFAGTDTTGNTFTYMFWELANRPEWQKRLRDELDTVKFEGVPNYSDVTNLPVLEALISETLRLWPASPASLPRIAPTSRGAIDGVKVPENVIVSCQSYTTQRDPSVFPEPDSFHPERWLEAGESKLSAMRDMILVWGKGQRICMGKGIATMELKVVTAAIMKKYEVELGSETTNDDMEMRDHFVLMAKGGKCMLKFKEAQH
ncbi:cytochrome P450 [Xylogone sp. PMI_703]|nr:cytochrome P450 [Xylogone sp. PMI_703]